MLEFIKIFRSQGKRQEDKQIELFLIIIIVVATYTRRIYIK